MMKKPINIISESLLMTDELSDSNVKYIYELLSECYWRKGIDLNVVTKFIENSYCVSILNDSKETIGFSRVITDYVSYGFITDVVVHKDYRRQGLAKKMIDWFLYSKYFKGVTHWSLITTDESIKIYEGLGFFENR